MRRRILNPVALWVCLLLFPTHLLRAEESVPPRSPEEPAVSVPVEGGADAGGVSDNAFAAGPEVAFEPEEEAGEAAGRAPSLRDPIEPLNRAIFVFNDKAYFWVMKPVAQGYRAVVPEGARVSIRNFFSNLATPIRLANSLLQGKLKASGTELLRFVINSTIGMAGFFDVARKDFHLDRSDEDLGQTFGKYGLGHGFYIVLPLLGPSSLRDAAGLAGDAFLDPVNYLNDPEAILAVKAFKAENEVSLTIGDYEDLKKAAVDPYVAVRDAYAQHRARKVER